MKVIFLDVDGVLNTAFTTEKSPAGYLFVEDHKIQLLKHLVERTGAVLVLSSDWRMGWMDLSFGLPNTRHAKDFLALQEKLQEFGLELMARTPIQTAATRGEEIHTWLTKWTGEKVESFVILDDMGSYWLRPYADRLVQTSFKTGLTPKDIERAEYLLNHPYEGGE